MLIQLTRDLNPKKGLVAGRILDWTRPVITQLSEQLECTDWFTFDVHSTPLSERQEKRRQQTVGADSSKRRGRPPKDKETESVLAE